MNYREILYYPRQILLNRRIECPRLIPISAADALSSAISSCVPNRTDSVKPDRPPNDPVAFDNRSINVSLANDRKLTWTFHGRDRIQEWDSHLLGVAIHSLVHDTIRATPSKWLVEVQCYMSAGTSYLSVSHYPQDETAKIALNVSVGQTYHLYGYSLKRHKQLGLAIRNAARIAELHFGGLLVCENLGHGIRYHLGLLAHRMNTRRNTIPPSRLQRILTLG